MLAQTTQPMLAAFATFAFWLPIITSVIGALITDLDSYIKTRQDGKPFDPMLMFARVVKAALLGAAISLGASGVGLGG